MQLRTSAASIPEPHRRVPLRGIAFAALLLAYALLTIGVLVSPSPVLHLDSYLVDLHLWSKHPSYYPYIHTYVMFGQRGPATLAFLPFFLLAVWRRRTSEPLVVLATALVLLNISV